MERKSHSLLLYYYDRSFSHMSWGPVNWTILQVVICHSGPWTFVQTSKKMAKKWKISLILAIARQFQKFLGNLWGIALNIRMSATHWCSHQFFCLSSIPVQLMLDHDIFGHQRADEQFFWLSLVTGRCEHLLQWTIAVICHTPWTIGRNSTVPYIIRWHPRGLRDRKKRPGVDFFAKAIRAGLTN